MTAGSQRERHLGDLPASHRSLGVASPLVVYELGEGVSVAAVEREPDTSPRESTMI